MNGTVYDIHLFLRNTCTYYPVPPDKIVQPQCQKYELQNVCRAKEFQLKIKKLELKTNL